MEPTSWYEWLAWAVTVGFACWGAWDVGERLNARLRLSPTERVTRALRRFGADLPRGAWVELKLRWEEGAADGDV